MRRAAIGLLLALALGLAAPAAAAQDPIGILVPYFSGEGGIGRNVSTTLYFQIWRTLRQAPWPNPKKLNFGKGIAYYQTEPLEPATADAALERGAETSARMVLWGDAKTLGDGVVVQAYLATPPPSDLDPTSETWVLRRGSRSVSLGLPRRIFDFSPFVLSQALVRRYETPEAMTMCPTNKAWPCAGSPLGDDWRALEHDNVWAHVATPLGAAGWLYLPDIDKEPNPVSEFAAALLSYDRGDFQQARDYFMKAAGGEDAGAAIRQDALALAAIAGLRMGVPTLAELRRLADQDPYSLYLFQATCMARLAATFAMPAEGARAEREALRRLVAANAALFPTGSSWQRDFEAIVED
jgi:hypothetical protein